jgi:hypothetical protein
VAKLQLGDLSKNERESAETLESASKGKMMFGDCVGIFKAQSEASNLLKPSTKLYRREVIGSISKSWPGIETRDVRKISANDCNSWAAKYARQPATMAHWGVLRAIFNVAIR